MDFSLHDTCNDFYLHVDHNKKCKYNKKIKHSHKQSSWKNSHKVRKEVSMLSLLLQSSQKIGSEKRAKKRKMHHD